MSVTEAFIDYGLFLSKTLTIALVFGGLLFALARSRRGLHRDGDRLEVTDLNDKYRHLARDIKRASLLKKDFQRTLKQDRKAHKRREKEKTKAWARRRLFVVDFHGDIKATEAASLREIVTGILMEARERDEVLLRLENAGGMVVEHGFAATQLVRLRQKNVRLTIAVDKVAASGGYLMACVADQIVAAPFAVVGSIGVVAQLPNFHRLLQREGVDYELHTAGEYKRTLTLFGENSDEGRHKIREQLEDTHTLFKNFIREYRPQIDLKQVATGEYWHGIQAVGLGLVDELKTSDDYLMDASNEADIFLVSYSVRKRPLERLISSIQDSLLRALLIR